MANAEVWTSGDGGRLWTPTQVAKAAAFRPRLLPSIVELQVLAPPHEHPSDGAVCLSTEHQRYTERRYLPWWRARHAGAHGRSRRISVPRRRAVVGARARAGRSDTLWERHRLPQGPRVLPVRVRLLTRVRLVCLRTAPCFSWEACHCSRSFAESSLPSSGRRGSRRTKACRGPGSPRTPRGPLGTRISCTSLRCVQSVVRLVPAALRPACETSRVTGCS